LQQQSEIILGIDPGTNVMGYGVIKIEKGKPFIIDAGSFDQRKIKDHYRRIACIFERTLQLIDNYKPCALAIESPFFGNNVQSLLKLGRAQGAAISAALFRSVPVFEYAPRKIKQVITGYGNASKEQVATLLQKTFRLNIETDHLDATDGLAAAVCHFYSRTVTVSGTSGKSWKNFITENPGRVKF
jgi:crossover junction endodeoxyribonuclease RuvC